MKLITNQQRVQKANEIWYESHEDNVKFSVVNISLSFTFSILIEST